MSQLFSNTKPSVGLVEDQIVWKNSISGVLVLKGTILFKVTAFIALE